MGRIRDTIDVWLVTEQLNIQIYYICVYVHRNDMIANIMVCHFSMFAFVCNGWKLHMAFNFFREECVLHFQLYNCLFFYKT